MSNFWQAHKNKTLVTQRAPGEGAMSSKKGGGEGGGEGGREKEDFFKATDRASGRGVCSQKRKIKVK